MSSKESKMSELRICRICLDTDVQMHQISGSEVQDVFEKLTNTQVQGDGTLYSVCYLCYWQLKKCQQLVRKSQKTEELLKQILLIHTEPNLKSVHSVDRLSHGLVHSLKISNIESFQMPENYKHMKSKDQRASLTYEVMVKDEPEDDWSHTTEELHELDEKQKIVQNKAKCIENISGIQKNTLTDVNGSSNIVNSLMIIKTESLKIPECNEIIESDEPRDSKNHEVMMKVEPEDDWTHTTEELHEPDEKQNIIQDKAKYIENISETQKDTFAENNKKSFTCNGCGKTFDTKALIIKHISKHDCVIIDAEDKCIKENNYVRKVILKKSGSLKGHIPMHKGEKTFKCAYCNHTCANSSNLKCHIRTHTGEKPFKCTYCNHTCATSSNLKEHMRTHTGEKPYKCQYCNYTCINSSKLKYHVRTHTGEKPFKCEYCIYTCINSSKLKKHIKTHTGEKPFKCEYCNYTCSTNYVLKSHFRTHTGEKPFKCDYCNYTCSTNYRLKDHIRRHTGEKPFKCKYCNYKFVSRATLRYHIRTHTGEKSFNCEYCGHTCSSLDDLKRHIRTHTGETPFKCKYCNHTCSTSTRLKRHLRTHTGE